MAEEVYSGGSNIAAGMMRGFYNMEQLRMAKRKLAEAEKEQQNLNEYRMKSLEIEEQKSKQLFELTKAEKEGTQAYQGATLGLQQQKLMVDALQSDRTAGQKDTEIKQTGSHQTNTEQLTKAQIIDKTRADTLDNIRKIKVDYIGNKTEQEAEIAATLEAMRSRLRSGGVPAEEADNEVTKLHTLLTPVKPPVTQSPSLLDSAKGLWQKYGPGGGTPSTTATTIPPEMPPAEAPSPGAAATPPSLQGTTTPTSSGLFDKLSQFVSPSEASAAGPPSSTTTSLPPEAEGTGIDMNTVAPAGALNAPVNTRAKLLPKQFDLSAMDAPGAQHKFTKRFYSELKDKYKSVRDLGEHAATIALKLRDQGILPKNWSDDQVLAYILPITKEIKAATLGKKSPLLDTVRDTTFSFDQRPKRSRK